MKFLQELAAFSSVPPMGGSTARLTDTQKSVLVSIYAAPTPEMAFDATTGSENVSQAARQLRSMGLINIDDSGSRAGITDQGQEALVNNNLVDDTGQLTDDGQQMVDDESQVKNDFENATESAFSRLAKLI